MEPLDSLHGEQVYTYKDGMTYVQQPKVYSKTFGQFPMDLLSRNLQLEKKLVVSMLFLTIKIKNQVAINYSQDHCFISCHKTMSTLSLL